MIIRDETSSDIEAISKVTIAAFRNLAISNHTEQFIINALRAANALTWCCFAVLFSFLMATAAEATCTQDFHFESGQLQVTYQANYGGEERGAQFLKDIKKVLPNILGLSRVIDPKGDPVDIFLGCQQYNKAEIEINKISFKTISCDTSDTAHVVLALADELDKKINPVDNFKGFTLQIAYIDRGGDVLKEKKRWRNKLDDVLHNGTMYIEGDCTQTSIWVYRYPDNSSVIRFGLFDSLKNAKKAITILKLGKNHSQIVPVKFKTDDLDKYFE